MLDVVKKYAIRKTNSRNDNRVYWSSGNVFCRDELIFSYGRHFPMAKFLGNHKKHGCFFLKNSDKYSSSTSFHQGLVKHYCLGPQVSRIALIEVLDKLKLSDRKNKELNNFDFTTATLDNIFLWRKGFWQWVWLHLKSGIYYSDCEFSGNIEDSSEGAIFTEEFKPLRGGYFKPNRKQEYREFQAGSYIIKEVLVMKISKYFLICREDDIVVSLKQPRNISEAVNIFNKWREKCKV